MNQNHKRLAAGAVIALSFLFFYSCSIVTPGDHYQGSSFEGAPETLDGGPLDDGFAEGTPILTGMPQCNPSIARDNQGNFVVVWVDGRRYSWTRGLDVMAHKFTAYWGTIWGDLKVDDSLLVKGPVFQSPKIAFDQANNIFVLYAVRDGELRLKKMSPSAARIWNVQVDSAANPSVSDRYGLAVSPEGTVFVLYQKTAGGSVLAKIDSAGNRVFGDRTNAGIGNDPSLALKGDRLYFTSTGGLVGRMDTNGNLVWKTVLELDYAPQRIRAAADNSGNLCVVYNYNDAVHYRKYSPAGVPDEFPIGLIGPGSAIEEKHYAEIAIDDAGNKFMVCRNRASYPPNRVGSDRAIAAQKLTPSDALVWYPDVQSGREVSDDDSVNQMVPDVAPDGRGGFMAVWWDFRSGEAAIYANGILSNGSRRFSGDYRVSGWSSSSSSSSVPAPVAAYAYYSSSSSSVPADNLYAFGLFSETLSVCVTYNADALFTPWTQDGAGMTLTKDTQNPFEGSASWKITGTGSKLGFSIENSDPGYQRDMTPFAYGTLKFAYKGKTAIRIGIRSGGIPSSERWLVLTNGRFGFVTNNAWCRVAIPLTFFQGIDFSRVGAYFLLATDSGLGYRPGAVFNLDQIYFTTNQTYGGPVVNTNFDRSNVVSLYSETTPVTIAWNQDVLMEFFANMKVTETNSSSGDGFWSWRAKGLDASAMGFGIRVISASSYRDMSRFANGSLKFRFRGTKPVRIGIRSGSATEKWFQPADLFPLGLKTNNTWCQVAIPVPLMAGIDLSRISQYFMLSADTSLGYSPAADYDLDDIYWTTNSTPLPFDPAKALVLYAETVSQNVTWGVDINTNQSPSSPNHLSFTNLTAGEGVRSFRIKVNSNYFDVNFLRYPLVTYLNLSAYANGTLNFMVKASKGLSVGIHIAANYDIMEHLSNGNYGFTTNNVWCQVSIPMSNFIRKGVNLSTLYGWLKFYGGYYEGVAGGEEYFIDKVYFYK